MEVSVKNIYADLNIELHNTELHKMIIELEILKDKNLINISEFPTLWQMSVFLKEKGIFEMQKIIK